MAGLDRQLKLVRRLASARQRQKLGLFVCEGEDLVRSWNELGRFLKRSCGGATAWILSGNAELTRHLGMKTSRRIGA